MISPLRLQPEEVAISLAGDEHLEAINSIYNHYVQHSTCTYQEEPDSLSDRRAWLQHHGSRHPATVAIVRGKLLGWGSLSPYHPRSAYRNSVENSVYVHPEHQRRGLGAIILADLVRRAAALNYRTIIAAIDSTQAGSIALHARHDFKMAGRMEQVGFKFGRWLDVLYLQRML